MSIHGWNHKFLLHKSTFSTLCIFPDVSKAVAHWKVSLCDSPLFDFAICDSFLPNVALSTLPYRSSPGLRILRMLISEFKLDTAQTALWELLHSLSDPEGRPRHFLDGLSACGRHLSHLISQEFYALCEECLLLLRNPKSPPSLCQLILNMLRVPFRCQVCVCTISALFFDADCLEPQQEGSFSGECGSAVAIPRTLTPSVEVASFRPSMKSCQPLQS